MALLNDIIDKIKSFGGGKQESDEPPKPMPRDKALEAMEREWQYYENIRRRESLKKKLLELKKKQIREHVFGIKKHEKEKTILDAKMEDSGVDLTKEKFNIMKAKKLFR